jgi:hypothetical protein
MAFEVDPSGLGGYLGSAAAALIAAVVGTSAYFSRKRVTDASDESAVKGFKGNDVVLDNLTKEVKRLTERLEKLEGLVSHLTDKLANVRLVALDCYQLANECECDGEARERLLEHLRTIIRDA